MTYCSGLRDTVFLSRCLYVIKFLIHEQTACYGWPSDLAMKKVYQQEEVHSVCLPKCSGHSIQSPEAGTDETVSCWFIYAGNTRQYLQFLEPVFLVSLWPHTTRSAATLMNSARCLKSSVALIKLLT